MFESINQNTPELLIENDVDDSVDGTGAVVNEVLNLPKQLSHCTQLQHLVVYRNGDDEIRSLENSAD